MFSFSRTITPHHRRRPSPHPRSRLVPRPGRLAQHRLRMQPTGKPAPPTARLQQGSPRDKGRDMVEASDSDITQ